MKIKPGDFVKIEMDKQGSWLPGWAEGEVISANNYGTEEKPNWYIEINKTTCSVGWQTGYGYWKQSEDGGKVIKL